MNESYWNAHFFHWCSTERKTKIWNNNNKKVNDSWLFILSFYVFSHDNDVQLCAFNGHVLSLCLVVCSLGIDPTTFSLALCSTNWATIRDPDLTVSCCTLQYRRSLTASSQSWSSFSTCSMAFSASLYLYYKQTHMQIYWYSSKCRFNPFTGRKNKYAIGSHLKPHKCTSPTVIAFGPIRSNLNGLLSICEGQRVLLQTTIAVGAIPKKPVFKISEWINENNKKRKDIWIWFQSNQSVTCNLSGRIWWPL